MRFPITAETILVRVDVPAHMAVSLAGTATVFSVARFADGSRSSVRLHMLDERPGEPRHGMLELVGAPAGAPPKRTCWVAES